MVRVKYHNSNGHCEDEVYEFATVSNAKEFIEAHGGDDPWPDGRVYVSGAEGNVYFELI